MNIILNGRHMEITPAIKEYASSKIGKFEKFWDNLSEAVVVLSVEKYRHKAEVMLKGNGLKLQAEAITGEIYSSIDDVIEKLERQLKKYKEKITHHRAESKTDSLDTLDEGIPAGSGVIIEKKRLSMKPMSPEDAALQIDKSGNDFFVFVNNASDEINVIYKIGDGNFGLIEPA